MFVLFSAGVFIFFKNEIPGVIFFEPVPAQGLENVTLIKTESGKVAYRITDLSYQKKRDNKITDIILSFNYPPQNLLRDDSKKYRIKYSEYIFAREPGALGKGCAKFTKEAHRVEIETVKNLWLGRCDDLGSFVIEFRFKAITLRDGSILFSRTGFLSGKRKGIEIVIRNRKVYANLYGVFEDNYGELQNIFLNRGKTIKEGRWYHFMLSFNRVSGKLAGYLNGEEEDIIYLSEDQEPYNGVFVPAFGARDKKGGFRCLEFPAAVIGKNFTGYIDEFRITRIDSAGLEDTGIAADKNYKDLAMIERIPVNIEGVITSPVYSFKDTGTKVLSFSWERKNRKNTFIWMEFRIYDRLFYANDSELKWYRIKRDQRNIYLKKNSWGNYLRGKYYQWRAHLVASPDGKNSPLLYDVRLKYVRDNPPGIPQFVEVVQIGDQFIKLKWKKNAEADIYGYKIYYGVKPGIYDGIITKINGRHIGNGLSKGNYIEVKITNKLINENRLNDKRMLLTYPFIRNNVLYFFAISAYDTYRPGTPFNHESQLSKEVSGRPFGGSEIDD